MLRTTIAKLGANLCLLVALTAPTGQSHAQQRQTGWIADAQNGCRLWNPDPGPGESIKWDGPCVNGFGDGKGTLRWFTNGENDETDEGEFRRGKLNGIAIVTWNDGRRFEGQWRDHKPNGQGTLRTKDSQVYSGEWRNGCFQQGNRRATQNATDKECGFR